MTQKFPLDWRWALAILLVLLAGLYFYLMRPDVAGLLYDDGMYLMAAKAMANGHGYRLMNIEGQPFFYKYPPLYPLFLAGIWLMNPQFPANIFWMKAFNILLFLATLALLAVYYRRILKLSPWVTLALVACLGFSWRLIDLSIELMSEPLYLFLSVLTLLLAHAIGNGKPEEKTQSQFRNRFIFGSLILLSVAAFYARSLGLVLIAALSLMFWLGGQRKRSITYASACGVLILPWFLWSASKPDTTYAIGDFIVRTFQETYFQSFKMDLRYEFSFPELYSKGLQELLGNFSVQIFPPLEWFFRSKPTVISESTILLLSFGLVLLLGRYAYQSIKAGKWSPAGLYIGLYLLILPSWSFFNFYPRFILMLLPFLLPVLVQIIATQPWHEKSRQAATWSLLTVLMTCNLMQFYPYLWKPVPNTMLINPYHDIWGDYQATAQYLRQQGIPRAVLYADSNDESYFYGLNANVTALDFFMLYPKALLDKQCGDTSLECVKNHIRQKADILYQVLRQKKTDYVAYSSFGLIKNQYNNWMLRNNPHSLVPFLLERHADNLIPVFQTRDGWITIYQLKPKS